MPGENLLYLQVADALRRQIVEGELAAGARLPSRAQLAEQFHVSENVVRRAIDVLMAEGLIETRTGARPTVRPRPQLRRLTRSWYREQRGGSPFRADMRAQGHEADWTCRSTTTTAPAGIAERLRVEPGAPVMRSDYVFTSDGEPVMISTSYEPLELTRDTPVMLPERGPHAGRGVRDRMAVIGQRIVTAAEVVTARPVTQDETTALNASAGTIVMVIQRTYWTEERPVETADIVVPVDRYELLYLIPVEGE
ncbi:GntR family transcriptional regulator [Actinoallomurus purpureus]|uniref:GntR family transcriptional regulator n=1 Tax=Actinoallomurus purpureus TaxID=478114 RepID=UPI0020932BED|nr:GntR family transcriptional regulator [Actinoallomurus purpureus]MCO6004457.1 GntR family transcriptional regulator [Actinoallomurus purpureus]